MAEDILAADKLVECLNVFSYLMAIFSHPSSLSQYSLNHWNTHASLSLQNGTVNSIRDSIDLLFSRATPPFLALLQATGTLLHESSGMSTPVILDELINRDVDRQLSVNMRVDGTRITPLHVVANFESFDNLKLLLQLDDIQIDVTDVDGDTALLLAAYKGNKSIIELLVNHGANIDFQYNSGLTVSHVAALVHQFDVVEFLLKFGARWDIRDSNGLTLFDHMVVVGQIRLCKQILDQCTEDEARNLLEQYNVTKVRTNKNSELAGVLLGVGTKIGLWHSEGQPEIVLS
ncbi:uncharacterized protein DNG_07336 [Cephalotrichum gorgonifer]|uniref:Ank_2 domain-containing protein n=1 Tax=Cephalotrichum gorgonifer TaxID=2041049 RepID=A0AAE8SXB1_9PEZI|nr:uncharacterized protein DNG_07336 [Cephalotrichum gorgonifer]